MGRSKELCYMSLISGLEIKINNTERRWLIMRLWANNKLRRFGLKLIVKSDDFLYSQPMFVFAILTNDGCVGGWILIGLLSQKGRCP